MFLLFFMFQLHVLCFFLINVMSVFLFCMIFCLFCVFCVFVLFLFINIVVSFLFVYRFMDQCHQVESQLQLINILYFNMIMKTSINAFKCYAIIFLKMYHTAVAYFSFQWLTTPYRYVLTCYAVKRHRNDLRKMTGEAMARNGPKSHRKKQHRYITYCTVTLQKYN
jgi:hypothetical protein